MKQIPSEQKLVVKITCYILLNVVELCGLDWGLGGGLGKDKQRFLSCWIQFQLIYSGKAKWISLRFVG